MRTCFDPNKLSLRTVENHNSQLKIVKESPALWVNYGFKKDCPFNKLAHFHICWGIPSDIAHGMFEGFGSTLIKLALEKLFQINILL